MLEIGGTVIYRNHVCVVAGVRERYFEDRDYYELRAIFEGTLKFYLPASAEAASLVRPAMTKREALRLIEEIPDIEAVDTTALEDAGARPTQAVKERLIKDEYARRLSQCTPKDLVRVVKSAYERTRDRELAGRQAMSVDKKFLALAEKLLCDELAVSLGMPREDVPGFLHDRVSRLAGA